MNILVVAVFFYMFIPASTVKIFIKFLFGCTMSLGTICSWSRKFLDQLPDIQQKGVESSIIIRHTDEKQIKIGKEKGWWWNTTDEKSDPLTDLISFTRSLQDTKKHTKKHKRVEKDIDINVTDGMPSYNKAMHIFGGKSKHIIRGLQEKMCMFKGRIPGLSNLPVERLHSKIDAYINLKFRGRFSNFAQAERAQKAFMLTPIIQKAVQDERCGTSSTTPFGHALFAELTVPNHIQA